MPQGKILLHKRRIKMIENDFHTQKAYISLQKSETTETMEDYIEMIVRQCENKCFVRVSFLAENLNVKPSSVSKMMVILRNNGYVNFERYGIITPTEKGMILGKYFLHRHRILNDFFCYINNSSDELELTEKIEHFFDKRTIDNIESFLKNISLEYDYL